MQKLSAKELTALGEQLGTEEMLINKYSEMSKSTEDPESKQLFKEIAKKHQGHFNQLKDFIK